MGVEMVTERLRLRPLAPADATRLQALADDLAVSRWLARVPHPYPEDEAERFIALCLDQDAPVWAVERLSETGLIGTVGIDGRGGEQSLGYWLGQPFWGLGYATEAASAAVDWAFAEAKLERLASGAFEGNTASLRVQEKLGFRVTGERILHCRALGRDVAHIDTTLPRAVWEARP